MVIHMRVQLSLWSAIVPGLVVFGILSAAAIVVLCMPVLFLMIVFAGTAGVLILLVAIVVMAIIQWRRNWLSGLSVLCAPAFVYVLAAFPHPVTSPIGWTANAVQVVYHYQELQRSYQRERNRGQQYPVGQVYLSGFGSLTSGLAYDPSRQIALRKNRRAPAWVNGAGQSELGLDDLEANHIFGSYYQWFHE